MVPPTLWLEARRHVLVALALGPMGARLARAQSARLPVRNLLVEVRQGDASQFDERSAGISGAGVVIGSDGRVAAQGGVGASVRSRDAARDTVQQIRVLNGGQAALRVGVSVSLQWLEWAWTPQGPVLVGGRQWVDTGRGVVVRPSWPGGDAPATVEIRSEAAGLVPGGAPSRYAPDGQPLPDGAVDRASVLTTVQLPLGEWLTIARSGDAAQATERGVLSTRDVARERQQLLQIRISAP